MNSPHSLPLPGIDGANPLGFLAALGTWRITDQLHPETKLHWEPHGGHWAPVLNLPREITEENFTKEVHTELAKMHTHPVFTFSQNLKLKPQEFKREAIRASEDWFSNRDRISASFLAAFGSSVATNDQGDIEDTAFRTMSGAGHQHFLKTMNDLASITTKGQIHQTLFTAWTYTEEKVGLRWDPSEDKRYALAWNNPSSDATMTQRGANRLAIEALPLFPTAPMGSHLETTGFSGHRSNDTFWTWPIWEAPISLDVGRSLLTLRELQETTANHADLHQRGITGIYRSQRITTGKFRNFTPARAI